MCSPWEIRVASKDDSDEDCAKKSKKRQSLDPVQQYMNKLMSSTRKASPHTHARAHKHVPACPARVSARKHARTHKHKFTQPHMHACNHERRAAIK